MENKIERVIKVLNKIIDNYYKLANESDNKNERDIYIVEALVVHSCIRLLTKENYLELLEKRYDIK